MKRGQVEEIELDMFLEKFDDLQVTAHLEALEGQVVLEGRHNIGWDVRFSDSKE